jgi:hypothetical protein
MTAIYDEQIICCNCYKHHMPSACPHYAILNLYPKKEVDN